MKLVLDPAFLSGGWAGREPTRTERDTGGSVSLETVAVMPVRRSSPLRESALGQHRRVAGPLPQGTHSVPLPVKCHWIFSEVMGTGMAPGGREEVRG
jgi:hypothetical protein